MADLCQLRIRSMCAHVQQSMGTTNSGGNLLLSCVEQAIGKTSRHVKQIIVEVKLSTWRPVPLLGTRHRSPHLRFEKHFDHRRLRHAAAESVSSSPDWFPRPSNDPARKMRRETPPLLNEPRPSSHRGERRGSLSIQFGTTKRTKILQSLKRAVGVSASGCF